MEIGDLTWTDLRDRNTESDVLLLPVGSTEQHGPHAPIRTDALVATELARRASDEREDTVCLPPVNVGVSEEHADFDGTLYVSPDTFRSYVREILESAASHGFEKSIVVNGHGGNIEALQEVCESLTRDGVIFATEWTWWRSLDDGYEMGHAGDLETSLVKYLEPDLVSDSEMTKGADSWGEFVSGSFVAYDTAEFSENGVVGDPTESSAEKGEEVFETSLESLGELIGYLRSKV